MLLSTLSTFIKKEEKNYFLTSFTNKSTHIYKINILIHQTNDKTLKTNCLSTMTPNLTRNQNLTRIPYKV